MKKLFMLMAIAGLCGFALASMPVSNGLVMHLSADEIPEVSSGNPVGVWPDLSGNGNHGTQLEASRQPVLQDSVFGAQPALYFDGSDDVMWLTDAASSVTVDSLTVIVVGQFVNLEDTDQYMLAGWDDSVSDSRLRICLSFLWSDQDARILNVRVGNSGDRPGWAPDADSQPHVFAVDSGVDFYTDGEYLGTSSNSSTSNPAGLNIGAIRGTSGFFNGNVAEVIVYDRVLSEQEYDKIGVYLANKYPVIDGVFKNAAFDGSPDDEINVALDASLTWNAGLNPSDMTAVNPDIEKHNVWMSSGDPQDSELSLVGSVDITDYTDPAADGVYSPSLSMDSKYYWAVEEVMADGQGGVYPDGDPNNPMSEVWSFETLKSVPVLQGPDNKKVFPSETASIQVGITTISELTSVEWYRAGEPDMLISDADPDVTILTDNTSTTLEIANADQADEGSYYAVVTNSGGSSTSETAKLSIKRMLAGYQFEQNVEDTLGLNDGSLVSDPLAYTAGFAESDAQQYAADPNGTTYAELPEDAYPKAGFGNGLENFTITAWIKRLDDSEQYFIGNFNEGPNTAIQFGFLSGADLRLLIRQNGNNSSTDYIQATVSSEYIPEGEWHLLTACFDGYAAKLYVDGILREEVDNGSELANFSEWEQPVTLFGRNLRGSVSDRFSGQIDDMRIFNYPLTNEEIAALYYDETGVRQCIYGYPEFDIAGPEGTPDCVVNLYDFAEFASEWLLDNRYVPEM
ncbi:LamG-like jellyroll fold domain-containing protein [Sedimentisphaera salicampi]|uniref:Immunoglobulin I-set domain protein n=1 Tax=Sedimentisphaera salicampi TaxID=1941349 RepID=A0A1W6LQ21_9BACT|nr:LamG-like jellyroll fold domain-containing protein [Sedimentisphaera salicampi]ARN57823.1 Immunoglobulin I-set domain protein [Sedimentisphaera salicampi]